MNTAVTRNDWVGRVIDGRFPLLEWLGNTEQAGVFRTELKGPPAHRAVIRLAPADPQHSEERLREWKEAAALSHPHLMKIFESGRAQVGGVDLLYVVTEFAEESLAQVIPERPLSLGEAREMLGPILDALTYLHRKGIVHTRIKPANIMVVGDRLKLPVESVRRAGSVASPPRPPQPYDAPEVAAGKIEPASDMWGLGITLVEALAQRPPSPNRSVPGDPDVPVEIPPPFAAIARGCLRIDAAKRITPDGIRALLNPARPTNEPANEIDVPTPAPAHTPVQPPQRATSPRTRMVAIGAAVVLLLFVIVYALTRSHPTPPPSPQARPPATPAPAPAAAAPPATAPRSERTVKGQVVDRVMPDVTAAASHTIHGKVDVAARVNVSPSGDVENAVLELHGPSRYFASKALDAARKWRFKPPQQDGHGLPSVWRVRFQFRRSGPEASAVQVSP